MAEVAEVLRGIVVFIFAFLRALGYHVKKSDYSAREGGYMEKKSRRRWEITERGKGAGGV